ncbi:MAG: DUF402 domain-containing protein [Candidatus Coatesbacteria bacterium]|nr:DUF402 domain-containing protein [Candidatus Coatesbacteria bacterium]
MSRPETVKFEFKQYEGGPRTFENDLVAQLPGLLITQYPISNGECSPLEAGCLALRFDFVDDWYSITAYLEPDKRPTGYYHISMQSPLRHDDGVWKGYDLILNLDLGPDWDYSVADEIEFCTAVEDGWMRVYAAANAREALRKICCLLDDRILPQEVMDAVCG